MTPKEKAEELFNKYWDLLIIHNVLNRRLFTKQCALIAVDEILKEESIGILLIDWWKEVKQEIEKL